jgi:hypothetical protein
MKAKEEDITPSLRKREQSLYFSAEITLCSPDTAIASCPSGEELNT